mmetsp:Transcript_17418/g.53327  ORF Transcript_17418/g.53327 Transcript_17418/m.53327 type:complete len:293 (-) Transcript_17418:581-1459(-)
MLVTVDGEIRELEIVNVGLALVQRDGGEGHRLALELLAQRLDVIQVHVRVADGVHELAWLEVRDLRDHVDEQCVGRDVKRHAEAHIAGALVEKAGELPVGHIELRHHVARRQCHLVQVARVPGREDVASALRVGLEVVDDAGELVDAVPGVVRVHVAVLRAKVAPLETVDRTKVAHLAVLEAALIQELARAVAVPDVHVLRRELVGVGATLDEPEELLGEAAPEHALRREQREAPVAQVEAHLHAELGDGARARAVPAGDALVDDLADEVQVLPFLVVRVGACHAGRRHLPQ